MAAGGCGRCGEGVVSAAAAAAAAAVSVGLQGGGGGHSDSLKVAPETLY